MFKLEEIRQMFPKNDWNDISFSYDPIDARLGKQLVVVRDDDYQGQTRILLGGSEGRYAIYIYSWGSCGGCDFAQACNSYEEMLEYANKAAGRLKWLSKEELLVELVTIAENATNDWAWKSKEDLEFVKECRKYFGIPDET